MGRRGASVCGEGRVRYKEEGLGVRGNVDGR